MMEEKNITPVTGPENGINPELLEYEMTELYLHMKESGLLDGEAPEEMEIPDIRTDTVLERSAAEPEKRDIRVPAFALSEEAMSLPESAPSVQAISGTTAVDAKFSAVQPEMPKTEMPKAVPLSAAFSEAKMPEMPKTKLPEIPSFSAVSLKGAETAPTVSAVPKASAADVTLTAAVNTPVSAEIPQTKFSLPQMQAVKAEQKQTVIPNAAPAEIPALDGASVQIVQIKMPESKLPELGTLTAQQADIPAAREIPAAEAADIPAFNAVKAERPEFPDTPPLPDFNAEIGAFMESIRAAQ